MTKQKGVNHAHRVDGRGRGLTRQRNKQRTSPPSTTTSPPSSTAASVIPPPSSTAASVIPAIFTTYGGWGDDFKKAFVDPYYKKGLDGPH